MTTPLEFYVEKAGELGILHSDLCDRAELDLASEEVVPTNFQNSSVYALQAYGGISFLQYSKTNSQGLSLLIGIILARPNLPAIETAPGRIHDIGDVVHKDYWFSMHDDNERGKDNFLEFTVREGKIINAKIDETQLSGAVAVQVPRDIFQTGRGYQSGLTWMLQLYAGK